MKKIDYNVELAAYCVLDDLHLGETVARFTGVEKKDEETVIWKFYCTECEAVEEKEEELLDDYVYIGSCPLDENPFHQYTSHKTCRAFLVQLKNLVAIPDGGSLEIKLELGGGGYYEVIAKYNTLFPKSMAWALWLEGNTPERWSPSANKILKGE